METLFIYLIKSSGLIGMFYLAYFLLLRKETFFNSNRWFLLVGLITSVVLPLVVFTKIIWIDPSLTTFDWSKIPLPANSTVYRTAITPTVQDETFEINWYLVFAFVYSIGILVFFIKFVFDFYSLSKVLKGKTIHHQADFKFIDITENISPFSYFNSIVYNSSLYSDTELENILEHEKVHSIQNHTIDVLISRLFCIVFWFNPLVWLYKKAIIQNLEFIADSEASKNLSDKKAYQLTLLKITTQENCATITNHFYQPCLPAGRSLIKKRIIMLNKNQSNKRNSWKYLFVLPLLGAFVFFFQVKVVAQDKVAPKQEKGTDPKIENDFTTLSKGKDIYINGEKSSQEELGKLNPNEIEKIDVARVNNKEAILITPKQLNKPVKITGKDIYIDGIKATNEEFSKLDQNSIDKVDVNTFENTVRIITKKGISKNENKVAGIDKIVENSDENTELWTMREGKPFYSFRKEFYIDGVKSTYLDYKELDINNIKIDTKFSDKQVRITTIKSGKLKSNIDIAEGGIKKGKNGTVIGYVNSSDSYYFDYDKALVILDGEESDYTTILKNKDKKLNCTYFCPFKAISMDEAKKVILAEYGDKARNGVIIVETNDYYNKNK